MQFFLILAVLPLLGAGDADAILRRGVEAQSRNSEKAGQYTYLQEADYFHYDKKGKLEKLRSETWEIMFVEGLGYSRLVARNGKPLDGREAAKEEKRLRQTAEERRKQRRSGIFHKTIQIGGEQDLLDLFDNNLWGGGNPRPESLDHRVQAATRTPARQPT